MKCRSVDLISHVTCSAIELRMPGLHEEDVSDLGTTPTYEATIRD